MTLIRGTALTGYVELVTERGGNTSALLLAAGISRNAIGAYGAFVDYVQMLRAIEGAARSIATADFGRHLALRQASRSLEPLERRHGAPPPWRRRYGRRPLPWGSGSNRRKTAGYTWAAAVRFVLRAAESDPVLATALTGAPREDFLPPLSSEGAEVIDYGTACMSAAAQRRWPSARRETSRWPSRRLSGSR